MKKDSVYRIRKIIVKSLGVPFICKMKKITIAFLALSAFIFSCKKENEPTTPTTTNSCTSIIPNKLSAKVSGVTWCADQSCFADLGTIMTINGLNGAGSSLTLELDDFMPGTYPITLDRNHVLYTGIDAYESTNALPGSVTITSNDTVSNVLKGSFSVSVKGPISGTVSISEGQISVYYTE